MIDQSLLLRMRFEHKEHLSKREIADALANSALISKLTADYLEHPLFATFRLMGLSEIPYSETLPYTQTLLQYITYNIATAEGFSPLGGIKDLVPCYNAMILEAYCRLGLADSEEVQNALNWIKRYQLFDRCQTTAWKYDGICKHGGCLGNIPCYIGVGKTVRALITYLEFSNKIDLEVEDLLMEGTEYMLKHSMYKRISTNTPISAHITDIMFPQNYALSLTDLVYIIGKREVTEHFHSRDILALLKEKETSPNKWKIDYIYKYKGYLPFEGRSGESDWITFLFKNWLKKLPDPFGDNDDPFEKGCKHGTVKRDIE